jgi:hypothetical protein
MSRRSGEDRRKLNDPNYKGPERRSGEDRDRAKIAENIKFKSDKHGISVLVINTKSEMMAVGVT